MEYTFLYEWKLLVVCVVLGWALVEIEWTTDAILTQSQHV